MGPVSSGRSSIHPSIQSRQSASQPARQPATHSHAPLAQKLPIRLRLQDAPTALSLCGLVYSTHSCTYSSAASAKFCSLAFTVFGRETNFSKSSGGDLKSTIDKWRKFLPISDVTSTPPLRHFAHNGIGANDVLTDGRQGGERERKPWVSWHTFLARPIPPCLYHFLPRKEGPSLTVTGYSRVIEEEFCEMPLWIDIQIGIVDCEAFIESPHPWKCNVRSTTGAL